MSVILKESTLPLAVSRAASEDLCLCLLRRYLIQRNIRLFHPIISNRDPRKGANNIDMSERKGVKRKKRSFVQNTLKFYKKGIRGQGVRIDDETFEYFLHILKIHNQEFDSDEDKKAFVENVFEQLDGKEVEYSRNQVVSRIVDNLLPFASDERVGKFATVFGENVRPTCIDSFASFVLQKLLSVVTERFLDETTDDETRSKYKPWLTKMFGYILNNMEEFVFDQYANHVMRTAVKCIAGETRVNQDKTDLRVDRDFRAILDNFVDRLLKWSRLSELPFQNLSSGFVQTVLQALRKLNSKRTDSVCSRLLDECYPREKNGDEKTELAIPSYFENEPCIRLLEAMLNAASPQIYAQIYDNCFAKRMKLLASHREANHAVQKSIKYCPDKEKLEIILDELCNCFEEILDAGNSGVIYNLCEACVRFKTKQSVFTQLWMNCLHCNEPKAAQSSVFKLTIFMKKLEDYDEEKDTNVNLHGSLIVQNLLKFNKPIKIINSMLEMKPNSLSAIFCNPKGSHVADAFFQSEFVGEKSKEKLVKMFQGCYALLATSKHGSRVFDTIWASSNLKNRILIASELSENEAKLHDSPFGRAIIYNISLAAFRHNRDDWIKAQNQGDKVKTLFANIS